jgi:hypothetical protein
MVAIASCNVKCLDREFTKNEQFWFFSIRLSLTLKHTVSFAGAADEPPADSYFRHGNSRGLFAPAC